MFSNGYPQEFQKGAVTVTTSTITAGFVLPAVKFALITHMKAHMQKSKKHKVNSKNAIHSLDELSVGDYIVHNVHGNSAFLMESMRLN